MVDTSSLIKNEQDIFNDPRVACFIEGEQEMNLAVQIRSPENLLKRIFETKTQLRDDMVEEKRILKREKCILPLRDTSSTDSMTGLALSDFYFVASRTYFDFMVVFFSQFGMSRKAFLSNQAIASFDSVFYFSPASGEYFRKV